MYPLARPWKGGEGAGISSNDVISACDKMAREILASPEVMAGRTEPPRIVIDAKYFKHEATFIINKNLFTDRLRVQLHKATKGKLAILSWEQAGMVEEERALENEGIVEGTGPTPPAQRWDFRLGGRIASLTRVNSRTGERTAYIQVTLELIERGTGRLVWTDMFEFKKVDMDDWVQS